MMTVFSRIDEDQNGLITEAEFLAVMVDLGVTVEEAHSLFHRYAIFVWCCMLNVRELQGSGDGSIGNSPLFLSLEPFSPIFSCPMGYPSVGRAA